MGTALSRIVAAAFIAAGIALAGFFASQTIYKSKVAVNTAEVKGLAERIVDADSASWNMSLELKTPSRDMVSSQMDVMREEIGKLASLANAAGFNDTHIHRADVTYHYDEMRDHESRVVDSWYTITSGITVHTGTFSHINALRPKISDYITKSLSVAGLQVNPEQVIYRFNGLNAIKPDMLKEATQNARIAAGEFAENAGVSVGGIRSARQGGFSVRDVGDQYSDLYSPRKTVRVVTTIDFYLTD